MLQKSNPEVQEMHKWRHVNEATSVRNEGWAETEAQPQNQNTIKHSTRIRIPVRIHVGTQLEILDRKRGQFLSTYR